MGASADTTLVDQRVGGADASLNLGAKSGLGYAQDDGVVVAGAGNSVKITTYSGFDENELIAFQAQQALVGDSIEALQESITLNNLGFTKALDKFSALANQANQQVATVQERVEKGPATVYTDLFPYVAIGVAVVAIVLIVMENKD